MKFYKKLREKSKFLPIFSAQMFIIFGLGDSACFKGVFIRQNFFRALTQGRLSYIYFRM